MYKDKFISFIFSLISFNSLLYFARISKYKLLNITITGDNSYRNSFGSNFYNMGMKSLRLFAQYMKMNSTVWNKQREEQYDEELCNYPDVLCEWV